MLLTVEGGGFFSSSASGYSKGLSLLILGCKSEEKSMRVSPWSQYQLVKQEANPEFQLASVKDQVSRGCTSFICFSRASTGVNGTSPPKVGPVHNPETSSDSSKGNSAKEIVTHNAVDESEKKICLRSSLKRPFGGGSVLGAGAVDTNHSLRELPDSTVEISKRRTVQWTDACGKELVEIKEFEVSEDELSDDDFGHDGDKCHCVIL
ncbi:hypothetical protein Cni_G16892 [Canna indica]|uniref:Uncharacterized protein n=1 Tax=Canna indica TaxID=4628 RepID=A0AAQ3KG12_9LILI|nr:hypothetical protein Cni_G16892 [Canna indica]